MLFCCYVIHCGLITASVTLFAQNTPVPITALSSVAQADASCSELVTSKYPWIPCNSVKALVSYSTRDVASLPYSMSFSVTDKVLGPNGLVIVDQYKQLFYPGTKFKASIFKAGVVDKDDVYYWTGSTREGYMGPYLNCNDYTMTSSDSIAYKGWSTAYNSLWLAGGFARCSESLRYLCICTNPP